MTPDERLAAVLTTIAGQLEVAIADQHLKRYTLSSDRVAPESVRRVLNKRNHTIETLVDICALLGYRVTVVIEKDAA